jgi:hypothetical protein
MRVERQFGRLLSIGCGQLTRPHSPSRARSGIICRACVDGRHSRYVSHNCLRVDVRARASSSRDRSETMPLLAVTAQRCRPGSVGDLATCGGQGKVIELNGIELPDSY